jgi:hypothetical protein
MRTSYRRARLAMLMIVTSLIVGSPASAQEQKTTRPTLGEAHQVMSLTPAELTWMAGPPMLPPGARMALIGRRPQQARSVHLSFEVPGQLSDTGALASEKDDSDGDLGHLPHGAWR